jgi:4-amino-4-deoxy-L-arabinose transferase-like glycosyltransferase
MDRKTIINIGIYITLAGLFLLPRLSQIDSFVTLDEPSWLNQGANFYYALGQREFENTVYEYQPAVTTMWIISLGMLAYFPEYRGLGQGYLDYEKDHLDVFMYERGYDPLVLLTYSRVIQIFILLILFLILYVLLQYLLPKWAAAFVVMFASFDPFFLGHTRMLDHEAMVSMFTVISVLSLAIYLTYKRNIYFLVLSGVAAGLAQLTKSSSIALFVPIGILLLAQIYQERHQGWGSSILNNTKVFGIWLAVLIAAYFVFWPGMWVAPGKMLYEVFGNAFSYAFQGARLKITESLEPSRFSLDASLTGIWNMADVLLYRVTPLTWLGVLLGFAFRFTCDRNLLRPSRQLRTLMLVTAIAFILLFGIAQGRNSPHYILSSYLSLNLLAGLGWAYAIRWILERILPQRPNLQYAVLAVVLGLQVWSAVSFFPYYYTYRNPILSAMGWYQQKPQFPYGEGLEIAAQYLSELPDADSSTVFSYYARGCFSYFYPGTSIAFRPYYVDGNHASDLLGHLEVSDYLIVYYANQGVLSKYADYLSILSAVDPIHVIWLDGYEYVRIYDVETFTPEMFEALADL